MVGERSRQLAASDPAQGQRRQRVEAEPACVEGLQWLRRPGRAVAAAQEELLVDVHRQRRRLVLELAVPAGDQLHRRTGVPALLQDLPGDSGRGCFPGVGLAARQGPPAVGFLPHRQHVVAVVEDGAEDVDLRGGIAGVTAELDRQLASRAAAAFAC